MNRCPSVPGLIVGVWNDRPSHIVHPIHQKGLLGQPAENYPAIMDSRLGFIFVLPLLFLRINLTVSSIDIKELPPLKCRIAGVLLVDKKFNYTMAETVCEALGLQIASKANIGKARDFGFETCSYGWVVEKYGVISRIQNNEKCGRNLTGVLTWTVPLAHTFSVYCFNSSDLQINSCKPELMVTIAPSTVSPTTDSPPPPTIQPRVPDPQGRTTAWLTLPTTAREPTSRPYSSTLMTTLKTTPKVAPPATTPKMMTPPLTEAPTNPPENQAARQSERIVFGKLPTALLILAVVFFLAAVVLAICYIRKYRTSVFFSKVKVEKESVETKVLREAATADTTKEEETTPNGKEEKPQNLEANTGNSMEAEV